MHVRTLQDELDRLDPDVPIPLTLSELDEPVGYELVGSC